ncbi:hypothetical protein GQ43DRAFT_473650 [Delitschia confertaspora ATCC 74209]|uniref:Uncharacterized protein n=1 Tax=Delitschia confertaspora ATCC 74209 TaxID=1513339 RepID=A0A9P4MQZ3_9PLEO|nr:hypothetical protein GQ43DRAFT_473650 [Delitschia confertaspora ATCC 74209]
MFSRSAYGQYPAATSYYSTQYNHYGTWDDYHHNPYARYNASNSIFSNNNAKAYSTNNTTAYCTNTSKPRSSCPWGISTNDSSAFLNLRPQMVKDQADTDTLWEIANHRVEEVNKWFTEIEKLKNDVQNRMSWAQNESKDKKRMLYKEIGEKVGEFERKFRVSGEV